MSTEQNKFKGKSQDELNQTLEKALTEDMPDRELAALLLDAGANPVSASKQNGNTLLYNFVLRLCELATAADFDGHLNAIANLENKTGPLDRTLYYTQDRLERRRQELNDQHAAARTRYNCALKALGAITAHLYQKERQTPQPLNMHTVLAAVRHQHADQKLGLVRPR